MVILLSGPEVDRLRAALVLTVGSTADRPDTPLRLETALSRLLEARGVGGQPSVLRRPATISTPEAWEIHLAGAGAATCDAIRAATRTGRFEP